MRCSSSTSSERLVTVSFSRWRFVMPAQQVRHVERQLVYGNRSLVAADLGAQPLERRLPVIGDGSLAVEGVHLPAQVVEDHGRGLRQLHLGEAGQPDLLAGAQEVLERELLRGEIPVMEQLAAGELHW
jgi:hypothetical protein